MTTVARGRFMAVVRLAVPFLILAALWQFLDGRLIWQRLLAADRGWLLAALCAAHAQVLLSALRWKLTAARLGQNLTARHAVAEYYLAQLVNQVVPGGVMGDASRAVRARGSAGLTRSAQGVVIERLAGQLALLAVLALGLAAVLATPTGRATADTLGKTFAPLLLALVGIAAVAVVLFRHGPLALHGFARAIHLALLARGAWRAQLVLGLLIVGCNLASFAWSTRATGTILPLGAVVTLVPLILTAMLIPLSVAGWGFREGAAAALLPLAGATPEAAIAASLAFGAVILATSLVGLFPMLARGQEPEVQ